MSAIPTYSGRPSARLAMCEAGPCPPLVQHLDEFSATVALRLFRKGRDTKDIAWTMEATEAAVANAMASAREQERANTSADFCRVTNFAEGTDGEHKLGSQA